MAMKVAFSFNQKIPDFSGTFVVYLNLTFNGGVAGDRTRDH